MRKINALAVFLLLAVFIFAQDEKKDEKVLDGVKIYEKYKDCVVDIQTILTLENGMIYSVGGSGFFINKDNQVATVAHVVKEKDDQVKFGGFFGGGTVVKIVSYEYFVVLTSKGRKYKAELVGANVYSDTACLKVLDIDPADYTAAEIGDPDGLKVGEAVYAIGMPYGLSNSLTSGKVSALHRYIDLWYLEDFVQTDTPINPGNSGSPLIDSRGRVVALNDAGIRGADGMGFAVSMKLFNLEQLKKGSPTLPWFGAEAMVMNFPRMGTKDKPRFQDMAELYERTGMDDPESLILLAKLTDPTQDRWGIVTMVDEVKVNNDYSPAKNSGIKRGDLVTKINGKIAKSGMDIRLVILDIPVGQAFDIELTRIEKNGVPKNMTLKATLQNMPKAGTSDRSGNGKSFCLCKNENGSYDLCVEIQYSSTRSVIVVLLVKVKALK